MQVLCAEESVFADTGATVESGRRGTTGVSWSTKQTDTPLHPRKLDAVAAPHVSERLSALIFDVDGTLYEQGPVRRAIFWRLLRAYVTCPRIGFMTAQALRAYREAQETLRMSPPEWRDIASAQILLASGRLHIKPEFVAASVARWMELEPLPLLASSIRNGMVELLQEARSWGLRLAAFSDYPADRKLAAMGLTEFFDVVVTAQDQDVQRFKPDPVGLEVAVRRLGVQKEETVYIGDREDVDALAASRSGIRHFILSKENTCRELLVFVRTTGRANVQQEL